MITEHWPSGAVTFLFTDIEDSTPLWDRHRAAMRPALAEHDALLNTAVAEAWQAGRRLDLDSAVAYTLAGGESDDS